MKTLWGCEVTNTVLHGHHVDRNRGFQSADLIAQPGFEELWAQRASDGDGEAISGDASHPEGGELIAIEIELRFGSASESVIADIVCDANNRVGCGLVGN